MDDQGAVTLTSIQAAREAIAPHIRLTPVWESLTLADRAGVPVYLKCEQMQRTGSFKVRGAANFVAHLGPAARDRGLVAASAGNHAQGVALAASAARVPVTVVMPITAPLAKANAARGCGARVVLAGSSFEDARAVAADIAAREGCIYVPPFDDNHVIAGQGTVGLEILEQVAEVAEVLVPAGGGGLLAGVATAIKALRPVSAWSGCKRLQWMASAGRSRRTGRSRCPRCGRLPTAWP